MKNSGKRPNGHMSPSNKRVREMYNDKMFWAAHPSALASIWIKHDWFSLSLGCFLIKWIGDLLEAKNEVRKDILVGLLKPLWQEMEAELKYEVVSVLCHGKHCSDILHVLWEMNDHFNCHLLNRALESFYDLTTGRNLHTNYFKAYDVLPSKRESK